MSTMGVWLLNGMETSSYNVMDGYYYPYPVTIGQNKWRIVCDRNYNFMVSNF